MFERWRAVLASGRPKPLIEWYHVTFDDTAVRIRAEPPGREAWSLEFTWASVVRVCFMAEADLWLSDDIYVFTSQRHESYVIPTEAAGGLDFWSEILRRKLFDATLAIEAATAAGKLYCWPPDAPPPG